MIKIANNLPEYLLEQSRLPAYANRKTATFTPVKCSQAMLVFAITWQSTSLDKAGE